MMLREKINHEWRKFFLDQMRTSKENIFDKSAEIELKRKIKTDLLSLVDALELREDETTLERLGVQENLLESAFHFCVDGGDAREDHRRPFVTSEWLATLWE